MPVVIVNMLAGRSAATKRALLKKMTAAVTTALDVPAESVRVIIQEMTGDHYGIAGLPVGEYRRRRAAAAKKKAR